MPLPTVTFLPSAVSTRVRNISYVMIDQKLDGLDDIKVIMGNPPSWQLNDIGDRVETQITIGNHSTYGYVTNTKYNEVAKSLTVSGKDYELKLARMYIHTDNVTHEDASSSNFRVIYDSVAFAVIAADIITNSGFSAGTINTYPVAGPDTTMDVRYEYMYVRDGLKWLANNAQVSNVTYDFWIDTSKQVQLQDRRGSATSVADLKDTINCTVVDYEKDTLRQAKRVVVQGSGNGSSQLTGVYPAAGFTPGDPEVAYYSPGTTSQTEVDTLAQNIYTAINAEIKWLIVYSSDSNKNVQIGDALMFQSNPLEISNTEYRVVRLVKEWRPAATKLKLYLSIGTNKQRKKTMSELFAENTGLTKLQGSVAKGNLTTLTFDTEYNGSTADKVQLPFNLSSDIVASNSDILAARLSVKRLALRYDTTNTTDDSTTGAGITNVQTTTGAGMTNVASTTGAGITNVAAGGASLVTNGKFTNAELTTSRNNTWGTLMSHTISTNHTQSVKGWICFQQRGVAANAACAIRLRADTTYYFPSSTGFIAEAKGSTEGETYVTVEFELPYDCYNKTIYLEFKWGAAVTKNVHWQAGIWAVGEHSHANTFNDTNHTNVNTFNDTNHTNPNTFNDANHQNPITQTVDVPGGEANLNISYDYDGGNVGTWNTVAVNDINTADLTASVVTTGEHYIDIYPTASSGRFKVTLEVDVFNANI